jgi:cation diffusion facilitator family transporter
VKKDLKKKAFALSVFTVSYNIIEGIVSIIAGVLSNSIALKGFGIDSFVESISGAVMIWRFKKRSAISEDEEERIEKIAQKLVAISFFILSAYILYESITKLYNNDIVEPSILGLVIIIMSIIVMPVLFYLKHKTGKSIGSKSLIADAKETLACLFLSIAVLLGILMNLFFGFWQADPIAAILIAIYLVFEGIRTLREEDSD